MNEESHRGDEYGSREEALRDIGKDLELGPPLQLQAEYDDDEEHSCSGKHEGDSPSKKKLLFRQLRNLSERKRRGKISDKFQQLQQLLPQGSSEVGQASILDGAITYIKSTTVLLQMLAKMSPENAKAIEENYTANSREQYLKLFQAQQHVNIYRLISVRQRQARLKVRRDN